MTEIEYRGTQDTNQLKKTFDAGYRKGRREGIDSVREYLIYDKDCPCRCYGICNKVPPCTWGLAERLKEQG